MAGISVLDAASLVSHFGRGMLVGQAAFHDSAGGRLPQRGEEIGPGRPALHRTRGYGPANQLKLVAAPQMG
jgi:hypothetical protein